MTVDGTEPRIRTPVLKNIGVTKAERYLKRLCDRTFLSLWSYPSIYRNQGGAKEVCDLLVVFGNHIIIFSDKDCVFPDTGNLVNDWNRWYKRAIKKSADQIWGAERWIKEHPKQLFLDSACVKPFPIELPDPNNAVFHRIVVAHSGTERCRREMNGGSGSLIIASSIKGDMHYAGEPHNGTPFWVGHVDPSKGFVHVFDDTSLDIVMRTLDTVSDFVAYLQKKEQFLSGKTEVLVTGEEDLLAYYLKHTSSNQEHDFVIEGEYDGVCITEGEWEEFQQDPQRLAQITANETSYAWDALVEQFSHHLLEDTQYFATPGGIENGEKIMRLMASENRLRRRMLSKALLDLMNKPVPKDSRAARIYKPDQPGLPYYVFLLVARSDYASYEEYRQFRYKLLEAYCFVTKLRFPDAEDIVGIATEPGNDAVRSEDSIYLDARDWTEELQKEAANLQEALGLLKELKISYGSAKEYPSIPPSAKSIVVMKGRDRNIPCPCGSGQKFKKCCGKN